MALPRSLLSSHLQPVKVHALLAGWTVAEDTNFEAVSQRARQPFFNE